jgi:hypothetical protein
MAQIGLKRGAPSRLPRPSPKWSRHPKRIHQRRLYCARYFGDPRLVVAALDNMDFGERT